MTAASAARRQRRLEAKTAPPRPTPFPGTATCCPKCLGSNVRVAKQAATRFYAGELAVCVTCSIAWEPIPEDQIWDRSDPCQSLREPCGNCAFRAGSPEQADTEKWKAMIASLRAGASFYCHKGVPLDPRGEHGFAYPHDATGKPAIAKQRLCRGYLNALGKWWGATA